MPASACVNDIEFFTVMIISLQYEMLNYICFLRLIKSLLQNLQSDFIQFYNYSTLIFCVCPCLFRTWCQQKLFLAQSMKSC